MPDYFMVDWKGPQVPNEHMLVARRVAQHLFAINLEDEKLDFEHSLCEGRVKYLGRGVYGSIGGSFFFVDLGTYNEEPHHATFFLPRGEERKKLEGFVIVQQHKADGSPHGYPEDIDPDQIEEGKLTVKRVRGV